MWQHREAVFLLELRFQVVPSVPLEQYQVLQFKTADHNLREGYLCEKLAQQLSCECVGVYLDFFHAVLIFKCSGRVTWWAFPPFGGEWPFLSVLTMASIISTAVRWVVFDRMLQM